MKDFQGLLKQIGKLM